MKKIFLYLVFFLVLFLSISFLSLYGIYNLFPAEFLAIKEKSLDTASQKFPYFKKYFALYKEKKITPTVVAPQIKQEVEIPESIVLPYFTNAEVYKAICENHYKYKSEDRFIGCDKCPKYIEENNADYFAMNFYEKGSILKKGEEEAVFFMNGCQYKKNDENNKNSEDLAIVLRKGFGGWSRVATFEHMALEQPPLVFKDQDGVRVFVGQTKSSQNQITHRKELIAFSFKKGERHVQRLFFVGIPDKSKCQHTFLVDMDLPVMISDSLFSVKLDVAGWQDNIVSDCKFNGAKPKISLKPGIYELHFYKRGGSFSEDVESGKIMTQIEKTQE